MGGVLQYSPGLAFRANATRRALIAHELDEQTMPLL